MIELYHGSNVIIENIDLSKCKPGKDFGKGFYLNPSLEQARQMAERTTRVLGTGQATINTFAFDDSGLCKNFDLKIMVFTEYSVDWADFIVLNRKNVSNTPAHDFDIVIGPIADDTVGVQIRRYIMGYLPAEQLVKELKFNGDKAIQYFFATERALKYLKRIYPEHQ